MERTLFLDELTSFDRSRLRPASSSPTSHSPSSHIKLSSSVKSTLVFDISKQFNKPENSDISIVCNDGSRIYVSSFILQARSPHFERVLQSGMKEAATKEIHIYASYEAAFALFRYFYSDSLDASPKIALEVMMLADMYLLENLRYDCESLVKRSLTVETALDLYEWSKSQFEDLSYFVSIYIWKNFGKISRTLQFRNLVAQNSSLLLELLNDLPERARLIFWV